ncbi:hypothetical protein [Hungatella hathewayi]
MNNNSTGQKRTFTRKINPKMGLLGFFVGARISGLSSSALLGRRYFACAVSADIFLLFWIFRFLL